MFEKLARFQTLSAPPIFTISKIEAYFLKEQAMIYRKIEPKLKIWVALLRSRDPKRPGFRPHILLILKIRHCSKDHGLAPVVVDIREVLQRETHLDCLSQLSPTFGAEGTPPKEGLRAKVGIP